MIRGHFFIQKEKRVRIPATFYSKAGKKRLVKIWNEHKLSDQLLFASLANNPNESVITERVTDYMQNYLQACMRLQRSTVRNVYNDLYDQKQADRSQDFERREVQHRERLHSSSIIIERKQNVLAIREGFNERCLQDEQRACSRQMKPAITNETEDATPEAEASSVDVDDVTRSPGHNGKLLPLSRSSGFHDETISPTLAASSPASPTPSTGSDNDEQDSLYDDFSEGRTADNLIKSYRLSDDDDDEQESEDSEKKKKLNKVLSNEVEFGWVSPFIAQNIFKEKNIEELCNRADQILKLHAREMGFVNEYSEELESLLRKF